MREKYPNTEFVLVRIFPHLDWIGRDNPFLFVFSSNAEKHGPEKSSHLDTFHTVRWFVLWFSYSRLNKPCVINNIMTKQANLARYVFYNVKSWQLFWNISSKWYLRTGRGHFSLLNSVWFLDSIYFGKYGTLGLNN